MTISSYQFQSPYSQQIQIGQPTPEMIKSQQESMSENLAESQDASLQFSGVESNQNQTLLNGKSSTMYRNDIAYEQTRSSVAAYQQTAQDLLKSRYVSAYSDNNETLNRSATT